MQTEPQQAEPVIWIPVTIIKTRNCCCLAATRQQVTSARRRAKLRHCFECNAHDCHHDYCHTNLEGRLKCVLLNVFPNDEPDA